MSAIYKTTVKQFYIQLWGTLVGQGRWIRVHFGDREDPRRREDLESRDEFVGLFGSPFEEIYYGVHLRGPQENRVTIVTAMIAEFSYKKDPYSTISHRLKEFHTPVSAVVDVGSGLECYWLLKKPFLLQSKGDKEKFLDSQRLLQLQVGAVHNDDLMTTLTVPSTVRRYTKLLDAPTKATFMFVDYSRRYGMQELTN